MTGRLEDRVAQILPTSYRGTAYRQQGPGYDPRSGAGARRRGGRFNPPRSFPVIYLAMSIETAAAELRHVSARMGIALHDALPREVFAFDLDLTRVLDLRDEEKLDQLGITKDELLAADQLRSREIGEAALRVGFQAIAAPSATGTGDVLAVLLDNLGPGRCEPTPLVEWNEESDIGQFPA